LPSAIDVLCEARARVLDEDEPYDYGFYQFCAVGHLFRAATGRYGDVEEVRSPVAPEYVDVVAVIAAAAGEPASGFDEESIAGGAALRISLATSRERADRGLGEVFGRSDSRAERAAAVAIYDRAIAALTDRAIAEPGPVTKATATATVLTTPHDQELSA
jgi:hypothetical protein